ncbi:hypothetical protein [Vibrio gallaecicus]|uniref:hypothetical protein n=1 Tax=Vibrio gallaecicus TaxID=552386 RepID=UPI0025B3D97B|nr:hypothetical protein [Vibrio gallaecicus]MDN3615998.1 hypothetical protein [Vibrio gallaecicus]
MLIELIFTGHECEKAPLKSVRLFIWNAFGGKAGLFNDVSARSWRVSQLNTLD